MFVSGHNNSQVGGGKRLMLPMMSPPAKQPNFFSTDKKKLDHQKQDIKKKFINKYEYETNWRKVNPANKNQGM